MDEEQFITDKDIVWRVEVLVEQGGISEFGDEPEKLGNWMKDHLPIFTTAVL